MKNVKHWIIAIILLSGLSALAQTPDQVDANAANDMMKKAKNLQFDMARLQALEPLPKKQLLILFPETLGDLEGTIDDTGAGAGIGILSVRGTYKTIGEPEFVTGKNGAETLNKKNKTFSIEVADGAGPGAPIFASMIMMSDTNIGSTNGSGQVKQITANGISGRQTYKESANHTALHFIYLDRFSISVTGSQMNPEETKEHFEKFDLGILMPKD